MNRRFFGRAAVGVVAAFSTARANAASGSSHRLAMQIDTDDHGTQALALGNARNYASYYRDKGQAFEMRLVAFGPGFSLVRADVSSLRAQIEDMSKDLGDHLAILACRNTRRAIAKAEGKTPDDILLLAGVTETPNGVVALAELQEAGWSYIRP